jgi:hypothetical protein
MSRLDVTYVMERNLAHEKSWISIPEKSIPPLLCRGIPLFSIAKSSSQHLRPVTDIDFGQGIIMIKLTRLDI